jgi:hypothetical protein
MARVIISSQDLLFRSKVLETGKQLGIEVSTDLGQAATADLVIVQLTPASLQTLAPLRSTTRARLIGFAGHLQVDLMKQAQEFCDAVMTNGQLAAGLPQLLSSFSNR